MTGEGDTQIPRHPTFHVLFRQKAPHATNLTRREILRSPDSTSLGHLGAHLGIDGSLPDLISSSSSLFLQQSSYSVLHYYSVPRTAQVGDPHAQVPPKKDHGIFTRRCCLLWVSSSISTPPALDVITVTAVPGPLPTWVPCWATASVQHEVSSTVVFCVFSCPVVAGSQGNGNILSSASHLSLPCSVAIPGRGPRHTAAQAVGGPPVQSGGPPSRQ